VPPVFSSRAFILLFITLAVLLRSSHAATVTWIGGDGDWSTPANWDSGALPKNTDDVIIDQPGQLQITHSSGIHTVHSLRCEENLLISAGTISVSAGLSELKGELRMSEKAILEASGPDTVLHALNAINIDGADLSVKGGATLSLPSLRSYHKGTGCLSGPADWKAIGANSVLDLSGLIELTGNDCGLGQALNILSQGGARISLNSVVVIPDTYLSVRAEGAGSTVDLSGLKDYQGLRAELSLFALSNGSILVPQLVNGARVLLKLQTGGFISTDQFQKLAGIDVFQMSLRLPSLIDVDNADLQIASGQLVLPAVRSFRATANCPQLGWNASGSGGSSGVLDLPALETIDMGDCGTIAIQGVAGGTVTLPSLVRITGRSRFTARGGSVLVPQLTELSKANLSIGPNQPAPSTFSAPELRFLNTVDVSIDSALVDLPKLLDTVDTRFLFSNGGQAVPQPGTEAPIQLNQLVITRLSRPFAIDKWVFTGVANQKVRFDLLNISRAGLLFSFTGPNGWSGFNNVTDDATAVTLPSSGTYILSAKGIGFRPDFSFRLVEESSVELTLGAPFQGHFSGNGQAQLFRISLRNGSPIQIRLSNAGVDNRNELYVSQGAPPTRGRYDYRSSGTGASAQLVVPNAAAGDWYVLVYGETISTPSDFTLEAIAASVLLTSVSPERHPTSADLLLTVNGGGFNQGTTVALNGSDGTAFQPTRAAIESTTVLTANFSANSLPAGTYSVRVTKTDGTSAVLADAFHVRLGEPKFTARLIVPASLGRHAPDSLYVEYANDGEVAMSAPLVTVRGTDRALLSLNPNRTAQGVWTAVKATEFNDTIQFLANGETPGILQAGEHSRRAIYYAGLLRPWNFADTQIDFDLTVLEADNLLPIDWKPFEQSLRPDSISLEAWAPIWKNFLTQVGTTAGQYVTLLADDQAYLGRLDIKESDVTELLAFELQRAAGLRIFETVASEVDLSVEAPALSPFFGRSFGVDIVQRYQLGPLGRGWFHNWESSLVQESDGTITILGPNVSARIFQPDERNGRGYFTQPGDHGTLTRASDGTFTLRELSGLTTRFRVDGKLDAVEEPNGNRITASYKGTQLIALTHSSGQTIQFTYNTAGRINQAASSQGHSYSYAYDASGEHLLSVTGPEGITSYSYMLGQGAAREHALSSITYPGESHLFLTYDNNGQLSGASRDGGAEPLTIGYESAGKITFTDAQDHTAQVFIDHRGLVAKTIDPLGAATLRSFDANYNLTRIMDALGQTSNYKYDSRDNLVFAKDPAGSTTRFTYTAALNRLETLTDPRGNITQYSYDSRGNQIAAIDAAGKNARATYDALGNLATFINRRNQTIRYTYDGSSRLTRKTYPNGTRVDYAYDLRGNLISAADSNGAVSMQYDLLDQLTSITYQDGHSLHYTYDAAGRTIRRADETGYALNYSYDTAGRLVQLADNAGQPHVTYTYDPVGRLSQKVLGNKVTTAFNYHANSQIASVLNLKPDGSLLSSYDYTYDILGRPIKITVARGDNGLPAAETQTFVYEPSGQLIGLSYSDGRNVAFVYDAAGNRVQVMENGLTTEYAANSLNQYTSAGAATYRFDEDGNEISRTRAGVTTTFTFDVENRLTAITTPTASWTYSYDPFGNRTSVTHNNQTTRYLLDLDGLANSIAEYDAAGELQARYEHGFGLIARFGSLGKSYYYTFSAAGDTSEITDSSGASINTYDYEPFGSSVAGITAISNPFQYSGEFGIAADDTGMLFIRARYYDPSIGRFLSRDPRGIRGGDPSLYRYSLNSPTYLRDFDGNEPQPIMVPTSATQPGKTLTPVQDMRYKYVDEDGNTFFTKTKEPIEEIDLIHSKVEFGIGTVEFVPDPPRRSKGKGSSTSHSGGSGTGSGGGGKGAHGSGSGTGSKSSSKKSGKGHGGGGARGAGSKVKGRPGPGGSRSAASAKSGAAAARDPNAKAGPGGFGALAFVSSDQLLSYRIDFENDAQATAPAQQVTISDPLSQNLDWNTFRLGDVGFGDVMIAVPDNLQHFETDLPMTFNGSNFVVHVEAGLRYASGEVYAAFYSLDPVTSLPPPVKIGFLPPEDGTGGGQGHVSYFIKAKPGLPTGTAIRNIARISFDYQTEIATNQKDPHNAAAGTDPNKEALVTIDADPPTSAVAALPESFSQGSTITWSGSDAGSGIDSFDIYVSTNGGPWTLWLDRTPNSSASFAGEIGQTYAFYSVGRDNAGQVEVAPATADTQTKVIGGLSLSVTYNNSNVILQFGTDSEAAYRLEFRDELTAGSWQPVTGYDSIAGTGSALTVNQPVISAARFYRVAKLQ
jgi:RHS repeat-associated protein